ncbi:Uncharacterized protein TCAP_02987 [Tolypocladium capitatum]|uniref:Uncharacterized protein n=1 Tax=Tolypocladium capitatum TaxID=45235 RepID=A0A2K3QHT3_9HYPO|nr:Uncharacterized protein TCAP_02987 [Tolypocladium capitatum]
MAHIVPAMLIRRLRSMDLADPDTADPDTADPDTADPDTADPDTADPDTADPDPADPDQADPDPADPDQADPDLSDSSGSGLSDSDPEPEPTPPGDGRRNPTPMDVVLTRTMLTRSKGLPQELVDAILDFAEYWVHSTNVINYIAEGRDPRRVVGTTETENQFLIRSYPLGLTGIGGDKNLAEELAYDTSEARPLPLSREHEPRFFATLVDYPTPRLLRPARKVVFSIKSKDQGWSSLETYGSYGGSYTWFEAGLERFDEDQDCDSKCTYDVRHYSPSSAAPPLAVCGLRPVHPSTRRDSPDQDYKYVHPLLPQDRLVIQRNKVAERKWRYRVVTWSYLDDIKPDSEAGKAIEAEGRGAATGDGSFVNGLRLGDVITIWGKARFPGWVNNIKSVRIDVYWAL